VQLATKYVTMYIQLANVLMLQHQHKAQYVLQQESGEHAYGNGAALNFGSNNVLMLLLHKSVPNSERIIVDFLSSQFYERLTCPGALAKLLQRGHIHQLGRLK